MANDVKNDPKAVKTTVGVVTNARIQDSQQPKMPLGLQLQCSSRHFAGTGQSVQPEAF